MRAVSQTVDCLAAPSLSVLRMPAVTGKTDIPDSPDNRRLFCLVRRDAGARRTCPTYVCSSVSLCPLSAFPFFGFQKLIIQIQKEDPTGGVKRLGNPSLNDRHPPHAEILFPAWLKIRKGPHQASSESRVFGATSSGELRLGTLPSARC